MMSCDDETALSEPFFLCVNFNKTLFCCETPHYTTFYSLYKGVKESISYAQIAHIRQAYKNMLSCHKA